MMKDRYIFPAIFTYEERGISIKFPDLPGCLPCADDTEKAVENAKEALTLHIWGMEQDGEKIPESSAVSSLKMCENQAIVLIDAFMPPIREKMNSKFVKKTLSIPNWLNIMATKEGINFSAALQNALKAQLHIDDNM